MRILVVGLGCFGLSFIKNFKPKEEIEIIAIDKNRYYFVPAAYPLYLIDLMKKEEFSIDLQNFCKKHNIDFLNKTLLEIKTKENKVILEDEEIEYDYLVLGIGGAPREENYLSVYSFKDIKTIKDKINDSEKICIIGGGLGGIETVCLLSSEYPEKKYTLVSRSILKTYPNKIRNYVLKNLNQRNIEIKNNIVKKEEYNLVIFAGGITAPKIKINNNYINNFIEVNHNLRSKFSKNIFCGGDCIDLTINDKKPSKSSMEARNQGKYLAKNILNIISNKSVKSYKILVESSKPISFIAISKNEAILSFKNYISITFSIKMLMKMKIFIIKRFTNNFK